MWRRTSTLIRRRTKPWVRLISPSPENRCTATADSDPRSLNEVQDQQRRKRSGLPVPAVAAPSETGLARLSRNRRNGRLDEGVLTTMPTSVTLPALGESVTEGTVTRWLKQVGDNVEADEPLLEVSTDKVDTEIPSPAAGVLLEVTAQEDETVEVGAVLAVIGDASEAAGGGDGSAGAAVEEQAATQPQVAQDIGVSGDA